MKYETKQKLAKFIVNKRNVKFSKFAGIFCVCVPLFLFVSEVNEVTKLKTYGKAVTGKFRGYSGGRHGGMRYEFVVDEKKYNEREPNNFPFGRLLLPDELDELNIWDEVEIIYLPDNPHVTRMKMTLNYNGSIFLFCCLLFFGWMAFALLKDKNYLKIKKIYNIQDDKYTYNMEKNKGEKLCVLLIFLCASLIVSQTISYSNANETITVISIEELKEAAKHGNAISQSRLGDRYYFGKGISQDYSQAAEWYTKAAKQGSVGAQAMLGIMYYRGEGVSQSYSMSAEWFAKVAGHGNSDAQTSLGIMYLKGEGVPQDYGKGLYWLIIAAEQGHTGAQEAISKHVKKTQQDQKED